jgi:four helix bundle protein
VEYGFDHEKLDVYKLALEVARACAALRIAPGRAHLRDQLVRAMDSVVLNLAEGRARGGAAGRNHFRIATGSAAEACACLDLVGTTEAADQQSKLRRISAMLRGLTR